MILMYHKVDIVTPTIWWVTPGDLDQHLTMLKRKQFVHLEDYTDPERQAVITFDDAYENFFRHALPVLRRHGVPFEVFVIGKLIGDWNRFDRKEPPTRHMGYAHLDQIAAGGGRLQWHTRSHPNLPALSDEAIEAELTIPEKLSRRYPAPHFTWLSYPGGAHDKRSVAVARRKFSGAVSVTEGEPGDRWQINRITIDRSTVLPARDVADILKDLPRCG